MEEIKEIIKSRSLEKVKVYFDQGHDVNKQYTKGETAIFMACEAQCLEIVDFLLTLGANPKIKEDGGYDAEAVAYWNGEVSMGYYSKQCKSIVAALKTYNANT